MTLGGPCDVALPYIANVNGEVVAVYVIETNPSGVNNAPPEAMREIADETLGVVESESKKCGVPIRTEIRSGSNLERAIFDLARTTDATSVGFLA